MLDLSRFAALAAKVGAAPIITVTMPHDPGDSDLLDAYEERAAILEYDAGLCRAKAERRAWQDIYGSMPSVRQARSA